MKSRLQAILVLALVLLLNACGFTLRGSAQLPPDLQTLHLEYREDADELVRQMRRALANGGTTVLDAPRPGVYSLGIGNEQVSERVLSVNVNARAGEYELTMSVPFRLRRGQELIIPEQTLYQEQVYVADPNNAVAKSDEAEQIRAEMRREMVAQILRRLRTLELPEQAG